MRKYLEVILILTIIVSLYSYNQYLKYEEENQSRYSTLSYMINGSNGVFDYYHDYTIDAKEEIDYIINLWGEKFKKDTTGMVISNIYTVEVINK